MSSSEPHAPDPAAPEIPPEPFPPIDLPVRPPFPPMEAKSVEQIPRGDGWLYEPKWDGFRCLAFRRGDEVLLQSKAGQPLGRYFPEVVEAFRAAPAEHFVLDGEIIVSKDGVLSFDDLLQRIHPAASRVKPLDDRAINRVETAATDAGLRGALRPLLGWALPARHQVSSMAPRQGAEAVHLRSGVAAY